MKTIFKKAISPTVFCTALILLLLSAAILAELGLRHYIVKIPNTEPYRAHRLYHPGSTQVALGDSHIFRAFLLADDVTNLGRGGSSFDEMDQVIRAFYALHPVEKDKANLLVLEASHQLFSPRTRDRALVDNAYSMTGIAQHLYLFEPAISTHLHRFFENINWSANLEKLAFQSTTNQRWIEKGASWQLKESNDRQQRAKQRATGHKPVWDARTENIVESYEQLLTDLKLLGVEVCLLKTPLSPEYIQASQQIPGYESSDPLFRSIAETQKIPYVDFRDIEMEWGPQAFANEDHLAPHLSQHFSAQVLQHCFKN